MKVKITHTVLILSMIALGNIVYAGAPKITDPAKKDTTGSVIEPTPYSDKRNKSKLNLKSYSIGNPKDSGILKLPVNQPVIPNKIKSEVPVKPVESNPKGQISDKPQSAKSNDDSILSFNFLYYIIEKYKLQDIID